MYTQKLKIGIIGGGAAGMMAAAAFKDRKNQVDVVLFEKNDYLGAKVIISGGGRCNVTTGIFEVKKLLENYPRGAKFLMSAMHRFSSEKVIEWFESHDVPLKIEDDLRVFPVSNEGKDIVSALEKELQSAGVKVLLKTNVVGIQKFNDKFMLSSKTGETYEVDFLILTTGGNAYRHTGSTGDGYAFAKALGHTLTDFAPSLNSFIVAEKWITKIAGVALPKVKLSLKTFSKEHKVYERTGPFLFTHHGVSGPAIFALSAQSAYENYTKEQPLELSINFFPDQNPEMLKKKFQELMHQHGKKQAANFLDLLLPKSLSQIFVEILKFDPGLTVGRFKKEHIDAFLQLLQNFKLQVVGRGAGDEFVTAGGVCLEEVHSHTMESKICPNLYFGGEILNIDGYTGGFNLQASWATGKLAGESIMKIL